MPEKISIPAIHDDDLKVILGKYNLLEQIEHGKIKCKICNSIITWDNLYGMVFQNSNLQLVCDSIDCIENLNSETNG